MRRFAQLGCALSTLLVCGLAIADDPLLPDYSPMPPVKIWTSGTPMGDASSDSRFTQILRWNLFYGSDDDANDSAIVYPNDRSPEKIADTIAWRINARGLTSGRIAISLIYTSLGNLKIAAGTPNTAARFIALMAHEDDALDPTGLIGTLADKRTPWKSNGIIEGAAWMSDFATYLKTEYVNTSYIPAPDRFIFDDEPANIFEDPDLALNSDHMDDVVAYWTYLKEDARFETEPVPGFGAQTLEDLWDAAELAGITDPTVPLYMDWHYPGGTLANSKWVMWFQGIMLQAEGGAMQEAFYDTIHTSFPNAKCSDYDRSLRLDGGNGGDNSYYGGNQLGAEGLGIVWDGQGDLQAPTLYPQPATYHYRSDTCPDPYALTNDEANELDWCGIEPFAEYSLRLTRRQLDAITSSFGGAYTGSWVSSVFQSKLTPWVSLPGQAYYMKGLNTTINDCSKTIKLMGEYAAGVRHIASCDEVRRTLAQVRSHGSSEVNIWNDNRFGLSFQGVSPIHDADEHEILTILNNNLTPEKPYAYSRLAKMVDQVWGFDVHWPTFAAGTILGGPSGANSWLKYDFGDYLSIIPAVSGTYRTDMRTTFTNAYTPIHGYPDYLRVNVTAASTSDTVLHVEIKNFYTDTWVPIDLDPADPLNNPADGVAMTGGTTGSGGTPAAPGPVKRVSGRIAVDSDYFGTYDSVTIRVATEPLVSTSGTNYVYYDMVQVIAEDDDDFSLADLNADGVVDFDDSDYWEWMKIGEGYPLVAQGLVMSALDFDQNGEYDEIDDDFAFYEVWANDFDY